MWCHPFGASVARLRSSSYDTAFVVSFLFFSFFLIFFFSFVFFFQAEDGIRDLVRSRGLGDVYKRQSHYMADIQALCDRVIIIDHGKISFDGKLSEVVDRFADFKLITIPVSYTHLTLPTSDLV